MMGAHRLVFANGSVCSEWFAVISSLQMCFSAVAYVKASVVILFEFHLTK